MQRLGDWSFSVYLVHQPVAYTFFTLTAYFAPPASAPNAGGPPSAPPMLTAWLICLTFIAITLLLSWLSYKYIEVPSRDWLNRRFKTRDIKGNLQTI
jgi:peptidoglycan/LPS O-acetylase OafA/YrhL